MKISKIIFNNIDHDQLSVINGSCGQFLEQSNGQWIKKNFHNNQLNNTEAISKIKIRNKKITQFSNAYDIAFDYPHLRERSIFCHGILGYTEKTNHTGYYIFPIDGYKFLYNIQVKNSHQQYKKIFEQNLQQTNIKVLKFNYKKNNLSYAIHSGCEIIIYNIPYYYAIPQYTEYSTLLSKIQST